MKELMALYAWAFPASFVFAGALALVGGHLAARNREMQTLCVSQGAVFGVLLVIGLIHLTGGHEDETQLLPTLGAFTSAAATFLSTNLVVRAQPQRKGAIYVSTFALLVAVGYLTTALFPALESHMSQAYFGDLATMTARDSIAALLIALLALAFLTVFWKSITNHSFEIAYFGSASGPRTRRLGGILFDGVTLFLIAYGIQTLGFLFTISCLFVPTTLLSLSKKAGLKSHLWLSFLIAAFAAPVGLVLSLKYSRIPTVPMIVLLLFALGAACGTVRGDGESRTS